MTFLANVGVSIHVVPRVSRVSRKPRSFEASVFPIPSVIVWVSGCVSNGFGRLFFPDEAFLVLGGVLDHFS